jgi:ubiquinone/menaquinone biosynthesis C-methylase UbiE
MEWFVRDFDHPVYFDIYSYKEIDAVREGPALAMYMNLPPQSLVLDLPCGWGRLHPYWLSSGWKHVGGDLSRQNLVIHASTHPSCLVRLDFRRLPFKDSIADGVMCAFTSWGYFLNNDDNLLQLKEYARVLKPGAPLILDLAGRLHLEKALPLVEGFWYRVEDGDCRERVRWTQDKKRILTDRIKNGHRFQHNIWIPTDGEIRDAFSQVGFKIDSRWGGLDGEPWSEMSERWIYRAVRM